MSLVVASLSHGAAGVLSSGNGDTVSQLVSSVNLSPPGKKRKCDDDVTGGGEGGGAATAPPLPLPLSLPTSFLFPFHFEGAGSSSTDKPATPTFDPTMAMLAAANMFDAQTLRSVDAWFVDVNNQQQQQQAVGGGGGEDMVKTASDILRSFVEHKMTSSGNGGVAADLHLLGLAGGSSQGEKSGGHQVKVSHQQTEGGEQSARRQAVKVTVTGGGGGDEKAAVECSECGKAFKSKTDLLRHSDAEHSVGTARMFKCDECPYETRHQSNLSVHRRTHTGERPYYCGACGQSYTQGHQLKTHIRSRHGGNMAFYNMDKHGMGRGPGRPTFDTKLSKSNLQPPSSITPSSFSSPSSSSLSSSSSKGDKISQLLAAANSTGRTGIPSSSSVHDAQLAGLMAGLGSAFPGVSSAAADLMLSPYLGVLPSHLAPLRPLFDPASMSLPGNVLGSAAASVFSHFFPFSASPPASLLSLTANLPPAPVPAPPQQTFLSEPLASLFLSTSSSSTSSVPAIFADAAAPLNLAIVNSTHTTPAPREIETTNASSGSGSSGSKQHTSVVDEHQLDLSSSSVTSLRQLSLVDDSKVTVGDADLSSVNRPTSRDNIYSQNNASGTDKDSLGFVKGSRISSFYPTSTTKSTSKLCEDFSATGSQTSPDSSGDNELEAVNANSAAAAGSEDDLRDDGSGCVYMNTDLQHPTTAASSSLMAVDGEQHVALACQHRQQLMRLRQNVTHLLSVLAPNICLDVDIDVSTSQIDDLLHEVLFGALDDIVSSITSVTA